MNSKTKYQALVLLMLTIMAGNVWSITASVAPTIKNVSLGRPNSVFVTWRASPSAVALGFITISSPSGEFRAGSPVGPLLGTVPKLLSKTIPFSPANTAIFPESVLVPTDVTYRAHKMGVSNVFYVRTFTGDGSTTVSVTLPITSIAAGGFNISRISLQFNDGSPVKVVEKGDDLGVRAEITFSGSGLLRGVWEIADPSTTAGDPVFRPLRRVSQYLAARQSYSLIGPDLPTKQTGLYLVRLRVTEPMLVFEPPVIRYYVGVEPPEKVPEPASLNIISPKPLAKLSPETVFHWQAITGTKAYQLEIYLDQRDPATANLPSLSGEAKISRPELRPGQKPVTGMMLSSQHTQGALSPASRKHLNSGKSYLWRVLAIGKDGTVIGKSDMRQIRMP